MFSSRFRFEVTLISCDAFGLASKTCCSLKSIEVEIKLSLKYR